MKKIILLSLITIIFSMPCSAQSTENTKPPTVKEAAPKPALIKEKIKEKEPENTKTTDITNKLSTATINEYREQAKFLYNSNQLNESMELFLKISETERNSDDWLFLANISQDKGKIVDSVFYLKKAISADEKNYKAHYNLGNIYYSDGKINMALDEYKKALKIKKDFSYAYYNKGCCYLKKKSWFNAKYEFGLAIKYNPEEPSFYYNLAYTYKMMKKPKKAQESLDLYEKLMSQ